MGTEADEASAEAGFAASHIVHFSVAVAGFFNMHVPHSHSPGAPLDLGSENEDVGAGAAEADMGTLDGFFASQIVHLSVAVAGFFNMQVPHSHSPSLAVGA